MFGSGVSSQTSEKALSSVEDIEEDNVELIHVDPYPDFIRFFLYIWQSLQAMWMWQVGKPIQR